MSLGLFDTIEISSKENINLKGIYKIVSTILPKNERHYSVSKQMYTRFEARKGWRHFIAIVYILCLIIYLSWRFTIISDDSLTLSIIFFIVECIGFLLGLTTIVTSWNYRHHDPKPVLKDVIVDVFVPTYKEPIEIIRRTLMAAREIEYPHQTWVLDDGRRAEVRDLAEEIGIHYISRPNNINAKAGNLNFALQQSNAEFIMVLDADHIALPHALDVTLGFFADEKVALVQTPQDFYNIDAFQYMNNRKSGGLWHDQSFFFNISQSCRDSLDGASCVGTGVVYRRKGLDSIGGIPDQTVTEDIHTSLKLHKKGHRVIYLNEPIAYGIAASDLEEFYKTRHRWASGNLHCLAHENILFCKGLSFSQRISYLSLGIIYLEGWQQLLLFLIPIITLIFGIPPFEITILNILIVLFFPIISYFLLQEIGCGFTRFWANEIFAMARWPVHIASFAGLFGHKITWKSSSKNIKGHIDWVLMMPQLSVLILSLLAIAVAVFHLGGDFQTGPLFSLFSISGENELTLSVLTAPMPKGYTADLVFIAGMWAFYSALRAVLFMYKAIHDAKKSHKFFCFSVPLPITLNQDKKVYGHIDKISENWISLIHLSPENKVSVGSILPLTIYLPKQPLNIKIRVNSVSQCDDRVYIDEKIKMLINGSIIWSSSSNLKRDELANALYSVDWHREFMNRNEYFLTPSDTILRILGVNLFASKRTEKWSALLYSDKSNKNQHYAIIENNSYLKSKPLSLITFKILHLDTVYEGIMLTDKLEQQIKFKMVEERPISSLVEKGLDQAIVRRYSVIVI